MAYFFGPLKVKQLEIERKTMVTFTAATIEEEMFTRKDSCRKSRNVQESYQNIDQAKLMERANKRQQGHVKRVA